MTINSHDHIRQKFDVFREIGSFHRDGAINAINHKLHQAKEKAEQLDHLFVASRRDRHMSDFLDASSHYESIVSDTPLVSPRQDSATDDVYCQRQDNYISFSSDLQDRTPQSHYQLESSSPVQYRYDREESRDIYDAMLTDLRTTPPPVSYPQDGVDQDDTLDDLPPPPSESELAELSSESPGLSVTPDMSMTPDLSHSPPPVMTSLHHDVTSMTSLSTVTAQSAEPLLTELPSPNDSNSGKYSVSSGVSGSSGYGPSCSFDSTNESYTAL